MTDRAKHVGNDPDARNPNVLYREHDMKCPDCGVWFDCRDLMAALLHDGPLPHGEHHG